MWRDCHCRILSSDKKPHRFQTYIPFERCDGLEEGPTKSQPKPTKETNNQKTNKNKYIANHKAKKTNTMSPCTSQTVKHLRSHQVSHGLDATVQGNHRRLQRILVHLLERRCCPTCLGPCWLVKNRAPYMTVERVPSRKRR